MLCDGGVVNSQRYHKMVKCWNCENLVKVYSGKPAYGRLFEKKYHRCKVKGLDFEKFYQVEKEKECDRYEEARIWLKK